MPVWLDIEEYEHGFDESLLGQHEFPCWNIHHGCYRLWNPDDAGDELETQCDKAIRFLQMNAARLQSIRKHLENPLKLHFGCRSKSSYEIPAGLIALAGELGMCLEVDPVIR